MGLLLLLGLLTLVAYVVAKGGNSANRINSTLRNYDFVVNRLAYTDMNPDYFGPETKVTLEGPNTFSYTEQVLKTLPSDVKSVYNAYEKNTRNEYVPSLVVKSTVCDDYANEVRGTPLFKCAHHVTAGVKSCPFIKGVYTVTKAKCTANDGPIMAPGHYWLINNTWITSKNVVILRRIMEFTIIRKTRTG